MGISKENQLLRIKKYTEDKGFICKDDFYVSISSILDFICKNGHILKKNYNNFKQYIKHNNGQCLECKKEEHIRDLYIECTKIGLEKNVILIEVERSNDVYYIHMKCISDNHVCKQRIDSFRLCKNCPECIRLKPIKDFFSLARIEGYLLNENDYIDSQTYIKSICPEGHDYNIMPHHFSEGQRCRECFIEKERAPSIEILKSWLLLRNNSYILDDNFVYKHNEQKFTVLCGDCKNSFITNQSYIIQGQWCPSCSMSGGESKLANILKMLNQPFSTQYRFFINRLKYDFILYNNRNEIIGFIEYDGEQHHKYVKGLFHKNEDDFKTLQYRDIIKNQMILNYNSKLLRIHYNWISKKENKWISLLTDFISSTESKVTFSDPGYYLWAKPRIVPDEMWIKYNVQNPNKNYIIA